MVILIKYPKFRCVFCVVCTPSNSSIISISLNQILKMKVVMFEISTANPKEYTLVFYSNKLIYLSS